MQIKISTYYNVLITFLCVYILSYITIPSVFTVNVGFIFLTLDKVVLLLLLGLLLFGFINFKSIRLNISETIYRNKYLFTLIFCFLLFTYLSVRTANQPGMLKSFITNTLYLVVPVLVFASLTYSDKLNKKIGKYLFYGAVFVLLIAVFEVILGKNVFSQFVNMDSLNEFQQESLSDKLRQGERRIQGTFANPLNLGQFIIMIIPVLVFYKQTKGEYRNAVIWSVIVGLFLISLFVRSRGVILILTGIGVFGLYRLLFKSKVNNYIKVFVVSLLPVLLFIGFNFFQNVIINQFLGGNELLSDDNRANQIEKALPLIQDKLYSGYGYHQGVIILDYGTMDGLGTIDNYFLTLLLDGGIFLLFSFVLILLVIARRYFRADNTTKLLLFGLILFSLNLFTLSTFEIHPIFYFLIGVMLYNEKKLQNSNIIG